MFLHRAETNFAANHYYRLNQIFLSAMSLWPYEHSKFTKINNLFHFAIMGSFVFFQLTSFYTLQFTLDLFVMVLSYAIPSCIYPILYYSFYANLNHVKQIWEDLHDNWNLVKNETERNIMRQYSFSGDLHTLLIASSITISLILYALTESLPVILDLIIPLNETRPRELHALTEYFVDKTTYFYLIFCHWMISLSFGGYVVITVFSLEIAYVEHICGLFRIASYRIEHSIDKYVSHNSAQKDCITYRNITAAVDIHLKALECSAFMSNSFQSSFFVLVVIGVTSTSLNLLRLLKAIIVQNIFEIIASILFINFHFLFLFLGNYCGQKITDYNNEVFNTTYNVQWYKASIKIRKLLLFILQKTATPYIINIGFLIFASVEGFSKLISMAMSYFTIIYTLL